MPKFDKGARLLDENVRLWSTISPDGGAISVIPENLKVKLTEGTTRAACAGASIGFSLQNASNEVKLWQEIRGHFSGDAGVFAALIVIVAGKIDVIEIALRDNFNRAIHSTIPAGCNYQMSVFVALERLSGDDSSLGLLSVDSIDVVFE